MSKYLTLGLFDTKVVSFAIFLFYALNQAIPSGYSYGSSLLLLTGLVYLSQRPWHGLASQDKTLAWLLLAIFCINAGISLFHGNSMRDLDISSRFLLATPVFLLLLKAPPRLSWLWAGIAVGGFLSAGIAIWQIYGLGWADVDGLSNGVRYGAITTMLGVLCIAGLLWARHENVTRVWLWRSALALGLLGAWYGSLMSGTRGAWIGLPAVFVLFCIGLLGKHNLRKAAGLCVIVLLAISIWVAATPNNPVKRGYDHAVTDIGNYFERGIVTGSIGGRFLVWHAAVINIAEQPLLGWGVKDYQDQLEKQVSQGTLDPYALELAHTHNMYLETLVYRGVVGLLAILALFIFPFFYFCQRLRAPDMTVRILAISGTSLLAVYSILGLSYVSLYRNDTLLFFLITLMTLWACMRAEEQAAQGKP
ncbi:O-antigen ligase family protein [Pollutimonas sp. M17]|uniref:O-antigen ligase family protein n=1 Tax=Pollutimonas sp. M17 TaxID=2962065 RepID=UPI0021F4BD5D|nr:O-antigen ligase family protein [Pollutimonas sp. M17]UYO93963.1 O-antigen ligase family protein [Pollutimonas sp. M17]